MNRNGEFVIVWQNFWHATLEADFYRQDGSLVTHEIVEDYPDGSLVWDGYRSPHAGVGSVGNDFLVVVPNPWASGDTPWTAARFTSTGSRLGSVELSNDKSMIRSNFGSQVYLYDMAEYTIDIGVPGL